MLSVTYPTFMLSVVMLSVVAPLLRLGMVGYASLLDRITNWVVAEKARVFALG
jgi:hypothetical protein